MNKVFLAMIIFSLMTGCTSKNWMLSLYRDSATTLRIDYSSKEACLEAGRIFISEKTADHYDCGYKCSAHNDAVLTETPICKQVCDSTGCRE